MFRKPIRLEKWIAFDGAGFGDLLSLFPDADQEIYNDVHYVAENIVATDDYVTEATSSEKSDWDRDVSDEPNEDDVAADTMATPLPDGASAAASGSSGMQDDMADGEEDETPDGGNPEANFLRDIGAVLSGAQNRGRALEGGMDRLFREYTAFEREQWTEAARERLKGIFSVGNDTKENLQTMEASLARQTDFLRCTPPDRREGILHEGVRDLADTTVKMTAKADALTQAMDRTALYLADLRAAGGQPPDDRELSRFFNMAYDDAMNEVHAKNMLRDPMGKELEHYERIRIDAVESGP